MTGLLFDIPLQPVPDIPDLEYVPDFISDEKE